MHSFIGAGLASALVYYAMLSGTPGVDLCKTKVCGKAQAQVGVSLDKQARRLLATKPLKASARKPLSEQARLIASRAERQNVKETIKRLAPEHGVPTWFALRIAEVESSYVPTVRGLEGEYGIYQMKCDTAKMIGYKGPCGRLLDAETNIKVGLKHLALAIKKSKGDLKLAASKHNGGLGRKTIVEEYVASVFEPG